MSIDDQHQQETIIRHLLAYFVLLFFRLIKTLYEENVNRMTEHVNKAMDKIESNLDAAIAEKESASAEKSDKE